MDRDVRSRLKNEQVIWLVTASRDARPQAVPVWFLWDGKSILIYAQAGVKVRHVRENPYVELHLNSDEAGSDVVRISGRAAIARSAPPVEKATSYLRKYRTAIRDLGSTAADFAETYRYPIRVTRLRYH